MIFVYYIGASIGQKHRLMMDESRAVQLPEFLLDELWMQKRRTRAQGYITCFFVLSWAVDEIYPVIDIKMPAIIGILIFSKVNFMLCTAE